LAEGPANSAKTGHFLAMLLTSVDCLECYKKKPYKPERSAFTTTTSADVATGGAGATPVLNYRESVFRSVGLRYDQDKIK
jgi:hypothetical protein